MFKQTKKADGIIPNPLQLYNNMIFVCAMCVEKREKNPSGFSETPEIQQVGLRLLKKPKVSRDFVYCSMETLLVRCLNCGEK